MSDEETKVNAEEELSEEQEIEAVIALMEDESDESDESNDDAGESVGADDKSDDSDGDESDSSDAGDESGGEGGSEEGSTGKSDKEERLATQWSRLLKKENELRKDKKELKDLRATVEQFSGVVDKIKEDPIAAFEQLFSSDDYKKITLKKLGKEAKEEPETTKERVLRERVEKLEGDKATEKESEEEEAGKAVIVAYEEDVKTTLDAGGEEFELMKLFPGSVQEARAFSELYAEEFEEVLDPKIAIGEIEKHFRKQLEAGLQTKVGHELITKAGYVKSETEESDDTEGEQKPTKKAKTVKNDLAATPGGVTEDRSESIDEDDMIADGVREFERVLALGEN